MGFNGSNAVKGIEQTEKGLNKVSEALGKFGILSGVMAIFGKYIIEVVQYAGNLKGQLDANATAARNFSDSFSDFFKNAKRESLEFGVQVLGTINRIGEMFGTAATGIKELFVSGSLAALNAAESQERAIRRVEERNDKMRKGQTEANRELATARESYNKALFNTIDLEDQIRLKQAELAKVQREMVATEHNSAEAKKEEVKILNVKAELLVLEERQKKAIADQDKKDLEERKKLNEELDKFERDMEKAAKDYRKERLLSFEEERELAKILVKSADTRTRQEGERLKVLEAQKKVKSNLKEIEDILMDGSGKISKADLERVKVLEEQNRQLLKQAEQINPKIIEQVNDIADATEKTARYGSKATRVGDISGLSNYELRLKAGEAFSNLSRAEFERERNGSVGELNYLQAKSLADAYAGAIRMRKEAAQMEEKAREYDERKASQSTSAGDVLERMMKAQEENAKQWKSAFGDKQLGGVATDAGAEKVTAQLSDVNKNLQTLQVMFRNEGLTTAKRY
jgi:hypothetical protein